MSREISTCRVCKIKYWQGNIEGAKDICNDCKQREWFREMKAKGCSVGDPDNLGKIPHLRHKKKRDLPKVEINGETHVDVMDLLFTDSRHEKKFLSEEEMEAIKRAEYKKRRCKRRKKRVAEAEKKRLEEADKQRIKLLEKESIKEEYNKLKGSGVWGEDMVEALLEAGYKGPGIYKVMGISDYYYYKYVDSLKSQGRISWYAKKSYTTKESAEIMQMYKAGYSARKIGKKYNRTEHAISEKIKRDKKKERSVWEKSK